MKGPNLAALAWRNLWRHRRRTLLTLSSISFGTMLAWLFTGIGDYNWREMIDLAARLGGGHVTLQNPEYLATPTLSRTVTGTSALRTAAAEDPDVERSVLRITGNILLASAARNAGAGFIAFDPGEEDATTLSLLDAVEQGELFGADGGSADGRRADGQKNGGPRGIVLGTKLAENLRVHVGNKVVYTLTDKHGEIVQEAVRVTGLLHTGAPSVDARLALLPLGFVQHTLGYAPGEAVQVALFLDDQRAADRVAERLQARLDGSGGADVAALPWHVLQPELAGFIAMKVGGTWIMEAIIMLLVAAGIFNTIFVSVMERMREFGVLRAIGWSPGQLAALVMTESTWLALVGIVAGVAVTAGPYAYLHSVGVDVMGALGGGTGEVAGVALTTRLRVDIYPENALLIGAAALVATLLAGIYPAWKTGRVDPAETIRLV